MIDWAAKWFEIRAEMGQPDVATMMYQDAGKELVREHFHHRDADGFGKIKSLLKKEGIELNPPIRPLKKPSSVLNFFLLIKGLLTHPRLPHNPWKIFSLDKRSGKPDEVGYLFLTAEENLNIKKMAEQKKLNLGFFILSELDQVVKKRLYKNPDDSGTWLTPVDLRGAYPHAPAGHNVVSFVPVELFGVDNPAAVARSFELYKQSLRAGEYWKFWELAQIGKWIGVSGMRWLAKKASTVGAFWMGSFSDLGVWNQPELLNSSANNRYWVIAPPGTHSYPVGITTIEWCGKRSITMKIHPGICDKSSTEVANELLNEFRKLIAPAKT